MTPRQRKLLGLTVDSLRPKVLAPPIGFMVQLSLFPAPNVSLLTMFFAKQYPTHCNACKWPVKYPVCLKAAWISIFEEIATPPFLFSQNWEFQVYVPDESNVFSRDGNLYIKPVSKFSGRSLLKMNSWFLFLINVEWFWFFLETVILVLSVEWF